VGLLSQGKEGILTRSSRPGLNLAYKKSEGKIKRKARLN